MTRPFAYFPVVVASLAAVYGVVAMSANARADDPHAVAHVPAELVQWHSGLTGSADAYVNSHRKSPLGAMDTEDFTAYLVMHGAVGLRNVAEDGMDPFDPAGSPGGSLGIAR